MKKKRGLKIHLSNRLSYTLIAIVILVAVGIGVYAATYTASGAGHPYTEISTCDANQILQVNPAGNAWTCANLSASQSLTGTLSGICMMRYYWRNPVSSDIENMNTQATLDSTTCTVRAGPSTCGSGGTFCTCPAGYTTQLLVTGTGVPQGSVTTYTYSCGQGGDSTCTGYLYSTLFTYTCVHN